MNMRDNLRCDAGFPQVSNDEDEGTVNYENTGDSSASVGLHWSTTSTSTDHRNESTDV